MKPFVVSPNADTLLKKRYYNGDEGYEGMCDRVSGGNPHFKRLLMEGRFFPNSPTLFNMGLNNGCTSSACFTADTIIHCLAGDFTVAELLEADTKKFKVFSTDGEKLKIGKAFGLRKTRENAKVYLVTFDTGESIKLTADHLVMMRDGSYKEVRKLSAGDSVMPFNNSYQRQGKNLRRFVCPNISDHRIPAYWWVFEELHGRSAKPGHDIHHINRDTQDDRPCNLEELTNEEHAREHITGNNPMHRPEVAAKISVLMQGNKRGVGPKPGTSKAMKGNQHALKETPHPDPLKQYQRMYARKRSRERHNHKVVSVEYVGREDVYDLSVHKYHNFAANGVFIHNCFVFNIADEMGPLPTDNHRSIVNTRAKAIAVAKAGGGVGYYGGELRPKGSPIRSIHRVACGPVAVMRDYHGIHKMITQGGKRDLAQMWVQPCWHDDIQEYIHAKDEDPQGLSSFNQSVGWDNDWIEVAFQVPGSKESVLWDDQCLSAWKHGCPGMFFPDTVNRNNPNLHLGYIFGVNPCGETPNRDSEPCNLGSLSLPRYFNKANRDINWDDLEDDVRTATDFLDDILDRNTFPHPVITEAANLTRKLGLGVMGWADLLALMHIHYDTQQAVDLGSKLMKFINDIALDQSIRLASVKGPYKGFSDETEGPFARNETRTSIAPTGSIAIIADVFGSIEPFFALEWDRTTYEGIKMHERISCWDELEGFVPKTANQVAPEWHVRHQAAFQAHTDLGVSKTVNLPNSATVQDVSRIYRMMYESGCKGGTIFRDGCRSEQVLVSKKTTSVFSLGVSIPAAQRRRLPDDVPGARHKFRIGGLKIYLHWGTYDDGTLAEIFFRVSPQQGSTVDGMLDAFAKTVSLALQNGVALDDLVAIHSGSRFEPSGLTSNPDLPVCTSIPDYVVRWLARKFTSPKPVATIAVVTIVEKHDEKGGMDSGMYCPECGKEAIYQAGCLNCVDKGCGWTRCG